MVHCRSLLVQADLDGATLRRVEDATGFDAVHVLGGPRAVLDLADLRVRIPDWDLRALNDAVLQAASLAQEAMGGANRTRLIVNMTAGHGFLHASLARLASEGGHEMVYWRREDDSIVRASPYVVGAAVLSERPKQMLAVLHKEPGSRVRRLASELGIASSTAYAAFGLLEHSGLVEQTPQGPRLTDHGRQWLKAHPPRNRQNVD